MLSVSNVTHVEIHTADPFLPVPSIFEAEIAVAKLRRYKMPGICQIPAELAQAGG
jgi:hypothetical protein